MCLKFGQFGVYSRAEGVAVGIVVERYLCSFVTILYGCNFTTKFSFQRIIECLVRMLKLSQFFIRLVKSLKFVGNSLKSAFNTRTKD